VELYLHSAIYVHCACRGVFSWGWNVECRDGASVLDVPPPQKKVIKHGLQVRVNVKFSLRFLTRDALKTCAGVEVRLHSFVTMTLA